jgi:hypothetical protein
MEVRLDTSALKKLIEESPRKVDAAVRATAFHVEGVAKTGGNYHNVTGSNRNSIYTKTSKGIHGKIGKLGDITPDVQVGEAIVAPSMEYSARLEFGFVGKDALGRTYNQPADPYLYPAMAGAEAYFAQAVKILGEK